MLGVFGDQIKTTFLVPAVFAVFLSTALGPFETLAIAGACLGLLGALFWALKIGSRRFLPPVERGTVGFFHPYAEAGGGGERVLWCAVKAIQEASPSTNIAIYTREGIDLQELKQSVARNFNIQDIGDVRLVPLKHRERINPANYPRFTLLRQAIGSVVLAWEGLGELVPEVFMDTCGWAFCYPLVRIAGSKVACYVHYPTISTDMLARVYNGDALYNNDDSIADSGVLSLSKFAYYQVFATLYGFAGSFAAVVMVNSSWTCNHIKQLWWRFGPPKIVYPPVDTSELQSIEIDRPLKQLYLVSLAQFRPEKNHKLQLEAYKMALELAEKSNEAVLDSLKSSRLKIAGSCRNSGDRERLNDLKALAVKLGITDSVDFYENIAFSDLKVLLGGAVGGLHTMLDEHFGISVVEYMAAGVIPIAHNSGGPKEDILVSQGGEGGDSQSNGEKLGYLAVTPEEYAAAIFEVLKMDQRDRLRIATAARHRATLFSQERFIRDFVLAVDPILPKKQQRQC